MNTLHADLMSVLEWAEEEERPINEMHEAFLDGVDVVAQKLRAVCEDHGIVVFDVV